MEIIIEKWRAVKDFKSIYSVSNLGRIYSRPRTVINFNGVTVKYKGKILSQSLDKNDYLVVSLTINGESFLKRVHRLVAEAFIDNDLCKKQVNHKDFNKRNNSVSNLEWNTALENIQHSYNNNRHINRIQASSKKVNVYKENIKIATYLSIAETSRKLDIPSSTVSDYLKRNRVLYGKAKGYHFELN